MMDSNGRRIAWAHFASELIGTALLVLVGLSLVILMFGTGTPMARQIPGEGYAIQTILLGEIITNFIMVSLLAVFIGFRHLRPFTPAIFPFIYAVMVCFEAPISGTSTNPARSLGPAIISGQWQGWRIYWVGPLIGAFAASAACSFLAKRITVAKLYYFDSDRDGLFRSMGSSNIAGDTKDYRE